MLIKKLYMYKSDMSHLYAKILTALKKKKGNENKVLFLRKNYENTVANEIYENVIILVKIFKKTFNMNFDHYESLRYDNFRSMTVHL